MDDDEDIGRCEQLGGNLQAGHESSSPRAAPVADESSAELGANATRHNVVEDGIADRVCKQADARDVVEHVVDLPENWVVVPEVAR